MNPRQCKKAVKQMIATQAGRDSLESILNAHDTRAFNLFAVTQNGSALLRGSYQALQDTDDSLVAIHDAVRSGDTDAAGRLCELALESLDGHLDELKGLL